jgi:hypothetical protein
VNFPESEGSSTAPGCLVRVRLGWVLFIWPVGGVRWELLDLMVRERCRPRIFHFR